MSTVQHSLTGELRVTKVRRALCLPLPAFGRSLLQQRQAGQHPKRVWVIFGRDWNRRPANTPSVCVCEGYAPGMIDWRLLAGVPAHVVWRTGERIYELVAEVAHFAAPVTVHFINAGQWPYAVGQAVQMPAEEFLYRAGIEHPEFPTLATLWTDAIERDYRARAAEWELAVIEDARAYDQQKIS